MLEPKRSAPDDEDGEQATLDLLASGKLEIEGRLVDASNATLYCTIRPPGTDCPPRLGGSRGVAPPDQQLFGIVVARGGQHGVTAPCPAEIIEWLVEDGDPVGEGQPLVRVQPREGA